MIGALIDSYSVKVLLVKHRLYVWPGVDGSGSAVRWRRRCDPGIQSWAGRGWYWMASVNIVFVTKVICNFNRKQIPHKV